MSWFKKLLPAIRTTEKKEVPEGLWIKCPDCSAVLYKPELERNQEVCPKCNHHLRVGARKRIEQFLDKKGQVELALKVEAVDRLKFKDQKKYRDRLTASQKATGEKDAMIVVQGTLHELPVVVAVFVFSFMGGSMGAVVGERFVQAVDVCIEKRLPFICFSASGGARMQEALISLLQMAKTAAALAKLAAAGLPYISVLTDPTTGGVSASLATLGDIIIAEPKALIGFAGARVIEQTIGTSLPEGFQRSEFLLTHGAIDLVIDRRDLRARIASLLAKILHQPLLFCPVRRDEEALAGNA